MFPRPIQPTNELFAWLKKLQLWVQSITPQSTGDITATRSINGTTFTLADKWKSFPTLYYDRMRAYKTGGDTTTTDIAEWNPDLNYLIGDVVRVTKTYHAGYEKSDGVYDTTKPIYIVPCWCVCVSTVPDKNVSSDSENLHREANICYGPLPFNWEPYILADSFVLNSSGDIRAEQGRYWEVISLLPSKMKVCIDGSEQEIYIEGAVIPSNPSGADSSVAGPGLSV